MAETPQNPGGPKKVTLDDVIDRAKSSEDLTALASKYPKAKAHFDVQARLDDSLARLFAVPEIALPSIAKSGGSGMLRRRWLPFAAAAALLLAGAGVWWFVLRGGGPDVLAPAYREAVAAGFTPETVCTTDDEFAAWCRSYMRQAIYPTSHPDGLVFVGWNTGKLLGPTSGVLLVKVSGVPVIVVFERRDRQTISPGPSVDPGLHTFFKRIGDVMLYEVTPNPTAVVLPTLSGSKG